MGTEVNNEACGSERQYSPEYSQELVISHLSDQTVHPVKHMTLSVVCRAPLFPARLSRCDTHRDCRPFCARGLN